MSLINWLNNLFLFEKILGIYRNYSDQKKIVKYLIVFQITIQAILHSLLLMVQIYVLLGTEFITRMNFNYVGLAIIVYITAMPSVMTGICYSGAFMSYLRSIYRLLENFKNDKKLINSLKKTYWLSVVLTFLFTVFGIFRSVEVSIKYSLMELLTILPMLLSQCMLRITILFQYLMFFVVIMIVVHLSNCLTSLISAVRDSEGSYVVSLDEQCDITKEHIQKWVELYEDLANCCEKVTMCFGRQFFFSLITALAYYILMTYQICYLSPFYANYNEEHKSGVVIIVFYLSVMMMPLLAGQKASNQGVKLRIELVRLYNAMIVDSSEADAKLIKDFIRLIKKNPLEIKLVSKVPAGMYILPVILTLAVNYLIVMLQFMHII